MPFIKEAVEMKHDRAVCAAGLIVIHSKWESEVVLYRYGESVVKGRKWQPFKGFHLLYKQRTSSGINGEQNCTTLMVTIPELHQTRYYIVIDNTLIVSVFKGRKGRWRMNNMPEGRRAVTGYHPDLRGLEWQACYPIRAEVSEYFFPSSCHSRPKQSKNS